MMETQFVSIPGVSDRRFSRKSIAFLLSRMSWSEVEALAAELDELRRWQPDNGIVVETSKRRLTAQALVDWANIFTEKSQ